MLSFALMKLTFGEAEGEDADADTFGLAEFPGTGNDGGSCSDYIIDNQQMLTLDSGGIPQFKDLFYVFVALPTPKAGLATFEDGSSHHLIEQRQTCNLADASGDFQTLVITTLSQSFLGQWYRHDTIDSIEETRVLKFSGHHPTHDLTYLWMVLVFQFVDDVSCLCVSLIVKQSCGLLYGRQHPEEFRHFVIVGMTMKAGSRQMEVTGCTNHFLRRRQPMSADHTESWGDQVEQPAPKTNRFHRTLPYLHQHPDTVG